MKKLNPESAIKILSKLDRLERFGGYSIAIYLEDGIESVEELLREHLDFESPEIVRHGKSFVLNYPNGSRLIVASKENMIVEKTTHIIFIDHRITMNYVADKIKCHICEYVTDNGLMMANPNPIYISFERENEENDEEE